MNIVIIGLGEVGRHLLSVLDKEGHETALEVDVIRFDEEFPDSIFTKRNLTRRDSR